MQRVIRGGARDDNCALSVCTVMVHFFAMAGFDGSDPRRYSAKNQNIGGNMIDKTDFIGSVTDKLQGLVGNSPAQPLKEDLEKNIKAILSSAFSKMELLTREEFDAQVAVLQRTREMVEALEKRVAELEQQMLPNADDSTEG